MDPPQNPIDYDDRETDVIQLSPEREADAEREFCQVNPYLLALQPGPSRSFSQSRSCRLPIRASPERPVATGSAMIQPPAQQRPPQVTRRAVPYHPPAFQASAIRPPVPIPLRAFGILPAPQFIATPRRQPLVVFPRDNRRVAARFRRRVPIAPDGLPYVPEVPRPRRQRILEVRRPRPQRLFSTVEPLPPITLPPLTLPAAAREAPQQDDPVAAVFFIPRDPPQEAARYEPRVTTRVPPSEAAGIAPDLPYVAPRAQYLAAAGRAPYSPTSLPLTLPPEMPPTPQRSLLEILRPNHHVDIAETGE